MRDTSKPHDALRSGGIKMPVNPITESISGRWVRPRKRKTPRIYTDEEKATIVAAYAFSTHCYQKSFAKVVGISGSTLSEWSNGKNISERALAMADDYKERIKEKIEAILEQTLDAMPDKIERASYWDLARTMGLAFDKLQLIDGKPTSITGNELPHNERARVIFALLDTAKQRQLEGNQIIDTVELPLKASDNDATES